MKMEIKRIQGTIIKTDTYTSKDIRLDNFLNLEIVSIKDNEITVCHLNTKSGCRLILSPQDIRNLIKWQLGQEEYQENNRKHEDKVKREQKSTSDFEKNRKIGENLNKAYKTILECKKLTETDLTSNVEKKRKQAEALIEQYDIKLDLLESIKENDPMVIGFTSVNPVELSKDYNTIVSDNNKNNQKIVDRLKLQYQLCIENLEDDDRKAPYYNDMVGLRFIVRKAIDQDIKDI